MKTPYSAQGNVTVEQQLTKDMVLSVSGIMSRGIHLMGTYDLNAPQPTSSYTYTIADANGQVRTGSFTTPIYLTPRPNTKYGAVIENTNGVDSVYDALAVTLNKRFTHGIQMLASYTWSHQIDDGQGQASNAIFFSSLTTAYNGANSLERASGWLDQRQSVRVFVRLGSHFYALDQPVRQVRGQWLAALQHHHPGFGPSLTTSQSVGGAYVAGPTGPPGQEHHYGFSGDSRAPFVPVNSILTPASYRADARLSKVLPFMIKDRPTSLALNFEVFNVSNSWSPTSMTSQAYAETTKGVLTLTPAAYGIGSADGGFPDGTQARRLQISARFTF